jgi:hypothetical protein
MYATFQARRPHLADDMKSNVVATRAGAAIGARAPLGFLSSIC